MHLSDRNVRLLALGIFAVGFFLGAALAVASVWPDIEATMFDPTMVGSASLDTLHCPILMTALETATLSASFTNDSPHESRFLVRAHISAGFVTLMDEIDTMVSLAPGETRYLEWPVTAKNAAYGYLVLARVHAFGGSPSAPYRNGSCGILVLGLPGSGGPIVGLALAGSLLLMAGGLVLWVVGSRAETAPSGVPYVLVPLFIPVLVGVVAGYFGWWALGVIILALTVLFLVVAAGYAIYKR